VVKDIMIIWIIVLSLSASLTYGQNNEPIALGVGFVIPKNPYKFDANSFPEQIFTDKNFTNKVNNVNVVPFFNKPDYGLYHFICLEKNSQYFKVLLNDSLFGYIPNNENFIFKTWETILMTASVQRVSKSNLIRKSPSETDKTNIINNCKHDVLKVVDVVEIQGEFWIEVSFSVNCDLGVAERNELKSGWIQWRNANKLLVNILLLS
jgi:hypothetical protein